MWASEYSGGNLMLPESSKVKMKVITHGIDKMRARRTLFRRPSRESGETYASKSSLRLDEKFSSQRAEGTGTTDVPPLFPPFH